MFAYCDNNPIMRVDPTGYFSIYIDFDEGDYDPLDDENKFAGGGGGQGNGNLSSVSNSGAEYSGYNNVANSASNNTFLPNQYYSSNKAPKYSTPNTYNTTIYYNDNRKSKF